MKKLFILVLVLIVMFTLVACGTTSESEAPSSTIETEHLIKTEKFYPAGDGVTAYYTLTTYKNDTFLFATESSEMYLEYLSSLDESQIISINISTYHVSSFGNTNTYFITYKPLNLTVEE